MARFVQRNQAGSIYDSRHLALQILIRTARICNRAMVL